MDLRLVPKSVTLNDLKWCNGRYFAIMYKWLKIDPYYLKQKYSTKNLVFCSIDCLEHKCNMSSFHNFTGNAKETFQLVL